MNFLGKSLFVDRPARLATERAYLFTTLNVTLDGYVCE